MLRIGILGATGYAGEELIRILLKHPKVKISIVCAKIEKPQVITSILPSFLGRLNLTCADYSLEEVNKVSDLVFLALPHRVSMEAVPFFLKKRKIIIDLSADYRLEEPKIYTKWYGLLHKDEKNISKAIYGLPELYRDKISKAKLIANPGCYPTSVILACAPLIKEGLAEVDNIIADSKSGVTGAGRSPAPQLLFGEVNDNLKAYKINEHQHQPEINQELSKLAGKKIEITFVPHLIPINRGILSTIYFKVKKETTVNKIYELYQNFYQKEPFVRILPLGTFPQIKDVAYTNYCDVGLKFDEEKKQLIAISTIDNLVKGASGQAVQNMNIIYGFEETTGLI